MTITILFKKMAGARIVNGNSPNMSTPQPIIPAHTPEATTQTIPNSNPWRHDFTCGGWPEENGPMLPHNTYGTYPKKKLPKNPKALAGPSVPKQSPMIFPSPAPHAAAGPKSREVTMGIALAGRSSEKPGMSGIPTLNGIRMAA